MTKSADAVELIAYSPTTIQRAEIALRCSPLTVNLLALMQEQSVDLRAIAGQAGVVSNYTKLPLSELAVENTLLWLINVGVLRREVDGQGITDSFRLTPLGRQLVAKWQPLGGWSTASWGDRLTNCWYRWVRVSLPV
jgi:hypothetical protein